MRIILAKIVKIFTLSFRLIKNINNRNIHRTSKGIILIMSESICKKRPTRIKTIGKTIKPYAIPCIKDGTSSFSRLFKKIGSWKLMVAPMVEVNKTPANTIMFGSFEIISTMEYPPRSGANKDPIKMEGSKNRKSPK